MGSGSCRKQEGWQEKRKQASAGIGGRRQADAARWRSAIFSLDAFSACLAHFGLRGRRKEYICEMR